MKSEQVILARGFVSRPPSCSTDTGLDSSLSSGRLPSPVVLIQYDPQNIIGDNLLIANLGDDTMDKPVQRTSMASNRKRTLGWSRALSAAIFPSRRKTLRRPAHARIAPEPNPSSRRVSIFENSDELVLSRKTSSRRVSFAENSDKLVLAPFTSSRRLSFVKDSPKHSARRPSFVDKSDELVTSPKNTHRRASFNDNSDSEDSFRDLNRRQPEKSTKSSRMERKREISEKNFISGQSKSNQTERWQEWKPTETKSNQIKRRTEITESRIVPVSTKSNRTERRTTENKMIPVSTKSNRTERWQERKPTQKNSNQFVRREGKRIQKKSNRIEPAKELTTRKWWRRRRRKLDRPKLANERSTRRKWWMWGKKKSGPPKTILVEQVEEKKESPRQRGPPQISLLNHHKSTSNHAKRIPFKNAAFFIMGIMATVFAMAMSMIINDMAEQGEIDWELASRLTARSIQFR